MTQRKSVLLTVVMTVVVVAGSFGARSSAASFTVAREWYWAVFGQDIGRPGMDAADLDGDGTVELVIAAEGTHWYILQYDGIDYRKIWISDPSGGHLSRVVVGQMDQDRALEILVADQNTMRVVDGANHRVQREFWVSLDVTYGLDVANIDADPAFEAIACNDEGTFIYDLGTGNLELALPAHPCVDLAVGETDGTPGLEIVIADRYDGYVLDAATGGLEWHHDPTFGAKVVLGDLDGDGLDEIIAGFSWDTGVEAWHGDTRTMYWNLEVSNLSAVSVADVEGDGVLEVIYGDAQWGGVHVLEGATGVEKWWVLSPERRVHRIAVADVDGGPAREIVWGAGSGIARLYVADAVTRAREWESVDLRGPFYGLAYGDMDADGDHELVFTTQLTDDGYDDAKYLVFNAETKISEFESPTTGGSLFYGISDIGLHDVDADPELEIFVPTDIFGLPKLECRDGSDHGLEWDYLDTTHDLPLHKIAAADVDLDGELEIISTIADQYLMAHDAQTGSLEWQSDDLSALFIRDMTLLRIDDVDGDDTVEVIAASVTDDHWDGRLVVIDPTTDTLELSTVTLEITSLDTADLDGDDVEDIVIGTYSGRVQKVDPVTGVPTDLLGPLSGEIHGLAIEDVTADGVLDYVFVADDRVRVVDGVDGSTKWVSDRLGFEVGMHDSLMVGDVDDDGAIEIWVNVGEVGHMVFEINLGPLHIFLDGFESGDTTTWSATVG